MATSFWGCHEMHLYHICLALGYKMQRYPNGSFAYSEGTFAQIWKTETPFVNRVSTSLLFPHPMAQEYVLKILVLQ